LVELHSRGFRRLGWQADRRDASKVIVLDVHHTLCRAVREDRGLEGTDASKIHDLNTPALTEESRS
jgi:hypothetical protein